MSAVLIDGEVIASRTDGRTRAYRAPNLRRPPRLSERAERVPRIAPRTRWDPGAWQRFIDSQPLGIFEVRLDAEWFRQELRLDLARRQYASLYASTLPFRIRAYGPGSPLSPIIHLGY